MSSGQNCYTEGLFGANSPTTPNSELVQLVCTVHSAQCTVHSHQVTRTSEHQNRSSELAQSKEASFFTKIMATILELIAAPLKIFEGLGLSPFQAFVVVGMLTSGAIMNWTYNFSNHDDDDDHHE